MKEKNRKGATSEEIEKVISQWGKRFKKQKKRCTVCSRINRHTENSYESFMGEETTVNTLPESRKEFLPLFKYRNHFVSGCPKCGQLYYTWFEKDNDPYWYGDGEYMKKFSSKDLLAMILQDRNRDGYDIFIVADD